MDIHAATTDYEEWLGKRITLIPADLAAKHEAMKTGLFPFFRATFYRWMQLWPTACPDLAAAPQVLSIGDLHVENFGTWRDIEGRLTWGINDFDEAYPLPYTLDLTRLAASAHVAITAAHMELEHKEACDAILEGYRAGLNAGGCTFVLAEHHAWLRGMVTGALRDAMHFWSKLDAVPTLETEIPAKAERAMRRMMPDPKLDVRLIHRVAGLGSLGRERYAAIAEFRGGKVAREAKALAPSACVWADPAQDLPANQRTRYEEIMDNAVRSLDPFVKRQGKWIVRRLAPDCSRVELASIPKERDECRFLSAMGFETANIHLGTRKAGKGIWADLERREAGWLHRASKEMVGVTTRDFEEWAANSC